MKIRILTILLLCYAASSMAQTEQINKDIQITKITDNAYAYTSWAEVGKWGRVGSNGLIITDNGKALLIDTPMSEKQTKELLQWINTKLKIKITHFVAGHWHDDCIGGLDYLNRQGVKSYAGKQTNDILKAKRLPQAKESFSDSTQINIGNIVVNCYYLGGGHSTDNIVVWVDSEKILFGGCMLKDSKNTSIGNTSDAAPLEEWFQTICNIETKFPHAKIVVPGHGDIGAVEILKHTKEVLTKHMK